jgi:hypothetical protein
LAARAAASAWPQLVPIVPRPKAAGQLDAVTMPTTSRLWAEADETRTSAACMGMPGELLEPDLTDHTASVGTNVRLSAHECAEIQAREVMSAE